MSSRPPRGPSPGVRTLVMVGCVLALAAPGQARPAMDPQQRRVAGGQVLAQAQCAACHAVSQSGSSPNRRAPPFRQLSGQFVELTLHKRLTEIAETGHYDMPPVAVHSDEVRDLVAYINSLTPEPRP